jgi:hypothetical protein
MAASWKVSSGTLSNNTVTIAANPNRRQLIASNNSDTVMTLAIAGDTATAAVGIAIPAGHALTLGNGADGSSSVAPSAALSLFCAGASKDYSVYEI